MSNTYKKYMQKALRSLLLISVTQAAVCVLAMLNKPGTFQTLGQPNCIKNQAMGLPIWPNYMIRGSPESERGTECGSDVLIEQQTTKQKLIFLEDPS